ncbi:MAG: hypothetical protein JF616_02150 [Fibrobacteres bacterium]|nr:hypothetical protein [Fibrobacterota bacterium]
MVPLKSGFATRPAWRLAFLISATLLSAGWGEEGSPHCGARGSSLLTDPEYLAQRIGLERALSEAALSHCAYAFRRACLDWESDREDAGRHGFDMAQEFCEASPAAARGEIASALARGDFGGAFAAFDHGISRGGADSAAVAAYAPAAWGGLSLTPYARPAPVTYRLPPGRFDPGLAWRLSFLPGAGLLYVGEPKAALSHLLTSLAFGSLSAWSGYRVFTGANRKARATAAVDFGIIGAFFFQRYYLGGMREARRMAREKNRAADKERVAALADSVDPFAAP